MDLYIDSCIKDYQELFPVDDVEGNIPQRGRSIEEQVDFQNKCDKFERLFFIQMNNAVFSGEYLFDSYIKKIENFENILLSKDEPYFATIRDSLKGLKEVIFSIQNKIKLDNKDLLVALTSNDGVKNMDNNGYKYFRDWRFFSILLISIDHTLINQKDYQEILIKLFYEIQATIKGLDNEDLVEIYEKLKSKCSFLLKKTFINNETERCYYSVDFQINDVSEITTVDKYNKDFVNIIDNMYPCKYGNELISKYQQSFSKKEFSSKGFILLAYYYGTSKKKSVHRFDSLMSEFKVYREKLENDEISEFDQYAIKSIENFIYNCWFSLSLKQKGYTLEKLEQDLNKIEEIQAETLIINYHPYKKSLYFLKNYFAKLDIENKEIKQGELDFYDNVFEKYKSAYQQCILHHFYPFQLSIEDCKMDNIFIASSFSKPISPHKLRDSEQTYKETKQYLKIKLRLSKREEEIKEIAIKLNSLRKENFEYLGVFIAVITFLFGGLNLFARDSIDAISALRNIFALGIVLALFMALLYIVLFCKKNRLVILIVFIIASLALLFLI